MAARWPAVPVAGVCAAGAPVAHAQIIYHRYMRLKRMPVGHGWRLVLGLWLGCVCALPAWAHVTLQQRTAAVGSHYHAVLQVPHGCDGADTLRLRVRIPEGVVNVRAGAPAGWSVETVEQDYTSAQPWHGSSVTRGVRTINWSGELPGAQRGLFAFEADLADTLAPGQRLYFPVVQECRGKTLRWIDASGDHHAGNPAPVLELTAPAPPAGRHE